MTVASATGTASSGLYVNFMACTGWSLDPIPAGPSSLTYSSVYTSQHFHSSILLMSEQHL